MDDPEMACGSAGSKGDMYWAVVRQRIFAVVPNGCWCRCARHLIAIRSMAVRSCSAAGARTRSRCCGRMPRGVVGDASVV
jgi:hypothetical protein